MGECFREGREVEPTKEDEAVQRLEEHQDRMCFWELSGKVLVMRSTLSHVHTGKRKRRYLQMLQFQKANDNLVKVSVDLGESKIEGV